MPNVKNRRIVVNDHTYRWSSIGNDYNIGIHVRLLQVEAAALEHLVAEGDGWIPRRLEVHRPGPLDLEAVAIAARSPRVVHLRLEVDIAPSERQRLERPGLSIVLRN